MNRREFLSYSIFSCLSVTLGNLLSCAQTPNIPAQDRILLKGMQIIDAHAHPDRLFPYGGISGWRDKSSTLKAIKKLGMAASSFASVGDQVYRNPGHLSGSEFESTIAQLESWMKELVEPGLVKLVLKSSDVPKVIDGNSPPGAILAIEGDDPLEGNPDRVSEFYHLGITH